ncbi:DUF5684 domain-containing protein [Xanthocytophaga flava]|uniref:DUF5684 domain-containing protein n=1 Tax=Xanthocytophaga flava TaxID=3048013 RepID=UPI0028D15346|nr:DUF5684 domain-containing protein [Xanthocytophaga flavus]MDJ1468424.1 DUF5684 domain-containing protein [Xanthocytophaga flavus]
MFALFSVLFLIYVGIIILAIVSWWRLFEKAGKPGWASIVPIYGFIVQLEIVGKPAWWTLLLFVPIVNIVILIWTLNLLCKSFGKDEGYTVGMLFLGFIFLPMLAFGDAEYLGPAGDPDYQFARSTYGTVPIPVNKDLYNSNN